MINSMSFLHGENRQEGRVYLTTDIARKPSSPQLQLNLRRAWQLQQYSKMPRILEG